MSSVDNFNLLLQIYFHIQSVNFLERNLLANEIFHQDLENSLYNEICIFAAYMFNGVWLEYKGILTANFCLLGWESAILIYIESLVL